MTPEVEAVARAIYEAPVFEAGLPVFTAWDQLGDLAKREYLIEAEAAIKVMEHHNKPKWEDAPEWAQWLAMDENGKWFFYENKPKPGKGFSLGEWVRGRGEATVCLRFPGWQSTLEPRPEIQGE